MSWFESMRGSGGARSRTPSANSMFRFPRACGTGKGGAEPHWAVRSEIDRTKRAKSAVCRRTWVDRPGTEKGQRITRVTRIRVLYSCYSCDSLASFSKSAWFRLRRVGCSAFPANPGVIECRSNGNEDAAGAGTDGLPALEREPRVFARNGRLRDHPVCAGLAIASSVAPLQCFA